MTSKERVLNRERERGKAAALDLAARAPELDGTAIIAEDSKVPLFVWGKDYSKCAPGTPIAEIIDGELQVFTMITPVNTAHYPGITPNTERSLYSLCHTKDPERAKAWVDPYGTSGMYMQGECYRADDGRVKRAKQDNLVHDAQAYPDGWDDLGVIE